MYKYNLLPLLRKLSYDDYQIALKWLPQHLGVSRATFLKWIYIKKGSSHEIASHHLFKMASFFECTIDELFNQEKTFCKILKKPIQNER